MLTSHVSNPSVSLKHVNYTHTYIKDKHQLFKGLMFGFVAMFLGYCGGKVDVAFVYVTVSILLNIFPCHMQLCEYVHIGYFICYMKSIPAFLSVALLVVWHCCWQGSCFWHSLRSLHCGLVISQCPKTSTVRVYHTWRGFILSCHL